MTEDLISTANMTVLVVDDDDSIRRLLTTFLADEGFKTLECSSGSEVVAMVRDKTPDLVLMDFRLPDMSGLEVLENVYSADPETPVVIMTAYDSSSTAIQAIQSGAYDFVTKPFNLDDLLHTIKRALEHRILTQRVRNTEEPPHSEGRGNFIGRTAAMQNIFKTIGRVAGSDATVMIYGDSGTGKEIAATAIHNNSKRRIGPFIKVSCASFVETLLESELFGHEKGAFTHAVTQRKGRFELANKGTIFLDEIGEMSLNTQKKLLRVLQEREFERVGSSLTIKTDVRIITATNRDLKSMVVNGTFREDLYYRINVITLTMPPLRDRREDIPLLVEHFLDKHRGPNKEVARLSEEAMTILMNHTWPGNVRDLENTIERAVLLARGGVIASEHVNTIALGTASVLDVAARVSNGASLHDMIAELERLAIDEALLQNGRQPDRAAAALGLDSTSFRVKLKGLGLDKVLTEQAEA